MEYSQVDESCELHEEFYSILYVHLEAGAGLHYILRKDTRIRTKSRDMDWIEPWQGGRRGGGWFSPLYQSSDIWDYRDKDGGGDDTSALANAHVDWRETPTTHVFLADLPGVRKEEVKVQVEDSNILQISGEKVKEEEDQSGKWHRAERRRGSFVRRFRLPENANLGDVKCSLENGVLRVVVPKIEDERSQKNIRYIDIA